jgi:hypothetical protein
MRLASTVLKLLVVARADTVGLGRQPHILDRKFCGIRDRNVSSFNVAYYCEERNLQNVVI